MSKAPKSKYALKKKRNLPDWMSAVYDSDSDKKVVLCKNDNKSPSSLDSSASQKASIDKIISNSMPYLEFKGSVIYSYNIDDCCLLCDDLLESLKLDEELFVGFDIEWPVTYQKGNPGKVALIQICLSEEKCFLFHVSAMFEFPTILKSLIENVNIKKIGLNIENDFWKLDKDYDIKSVPIISHSVIELRKLANTKLKCSENWSLDGLVRNVLRCKLNKDASVRCGDWSMFPLTSEQQKYAAIDAFACLKLYNLLINK